MRAKEKNIDYKLIHNASIINACGCCGLQLYNFGEVVSIPLWTETWKPTSFLTKIHNNLKAGLHTLCLLGLFVFKFYIYYSDDLKCLYLDIKVKEQSIEAMMKGKKEYLPPMFMSVNLAARQLIDSIKIFSTSSSSENDEQTLNEPLILKEETICVALARIGSDTQLIQKAQLKDLLELEMGPPLHSLIIAGKLHPLENDMLKLFE